MTNDNAPDPDDSFTPEQVVILWLLGADPSWELASDVPPWVKDDALAHGLVFQAAPNLWRKTLKGDQFVKRRVGE